MSSPEFSAWVGMRTRCYYTKGKDYKNYGGRGIQVWEGWMHDFDAFFAHVGVKPTPKHTLDRIDNEGHYEPGNVRWATRSEQNRNRRPSIPLEDLTNRRFGRLIAVSPVRGARRGQRGSFTTRWKCVCDCGGTALVKLSNLKEGTTKSCGCLKRSTMQRGADGKRFHPI